MDKDLLLKDTLLYIIFACVGFAATLVATDQPMEGLAFISVAVVCAVFRTWSKAQNRKK